MLLALVIWVTILFVLYSWGDFTLSVYRKLTTNSSELYNITETFLIGLCTILIPIQALSFFSPINQYVLLGFVAFSCVYWFFRQNKFSDVFNGIGAKWKSLPFSGKLTLIISFLLILVASTTYYQFYDAEYYHYQNIKWNETYAVVPGLGNLEDRFGFNSSYLLLTGVFSFSFVKGEVYTMLQVVLFVLIWIEFVVKLYQSNWTMKYMLTVLLLGCMYFLNYNWFRCSSTDIVPILGVSYLLMKIAHKPEILLEKSFFFIVVLATLLTFKISIGFIALICLWPLIVMIKGREYSRMWFSLGVTFFILAFWLIRNVILTGYLIFPLYQIDIFSFDWKIPSAVLQIEQEHIKAWAYHLFHKSLTELYYPLYIRSNLFLGFISLLMPIFLFVQRRNISEKLMLVAIVSYISMIIGGVSAPDVRFVNGFIFGNLTILIVLVWNDSNKIRNKVLKCLTIAVLCFVFLYPFFYFDTSQSIEKTIVLVPQSCNKVAKPNRQAFGNLTIKVLAKDGDCPYYGLPIVPPGGLPTGFLGHKIQSLESIEPRGTSLQDGFRPIEKYTRILNENVEQYIIDYYEAGYGIKKIERKNDR